MKISFVIPTAGNRGKIIDLCVASIIETAGDCAEIILTGKIDTLHHLSKYANVRLVDMTYEANSALVGELRNCGAELSTNEIIVFADDDVIFSKDWYINFVEYNKLNSNWVCMNNRVLLPTGGRYWDKAIVSEFNQTMKDYDYPVEDSTTFVCGCFFIVKRSIFQTIKIDKAAKSYNGGTNKIVPLAEIETTEDVSFSRKLYKNNYVIDIDKNNFVWHFAEHFFHIHRLYDTVNHDVIAIGSNLPSEAPHTVVTDEVMLYKFYDYLLFLYEKYNIVSISPNQTYGEKLFDLYWEVFNRKPDISGYINYVSKNIPIEKLKTIFYNSEEYNRK